ncbi:MAG: DUF4238 domain-containing protein [Coriobacteriia bacterium]
MKPRSNQPKKHHYVPCVLLSRFGDGEGRNTLIWVWDKQTGKVRRTSVNDAAHEKHLYRVPREDCALIADLPGMRSLPEEYQGELGWEHMFADIEGIFGTLLDSMSENLRIPERGSDDWRFLLHTFFLLSARTPAKMEEARVVGELTLNMFAQLEVNRSDDPEREAPRYEMPFRENSHILLAHTLLSMEPVVALLAERNWSLRVVNDPANFILTDYPVSYSFARPSRNEFDSAAPATKNTLATLPLSRNMLLVGEFEVPSGMRMGDARWVGYQNNLAFTLAERFLFTREDRFDCLTDFERLPAYASIYGSEERLVTITPELFRSMHEKGALEKPVRMTVNGQLPQDYRLS